MSEYPAALYLLPLFVLAFGTFGPPTSSASLIEVDFLAPGDDLLLYDTETGLEWLDVTETLGLSYNNLINGEGPIDYVNAHGFRFANTLEVADLWAHAGIVDFSGAHSGRPEPGQPQS